MVTLFRRRTRRPREMDHILHDTLMAVARVLHHDSLVGAPGATVEVTYDAAARIAMATVLDPVQGQPLGRSVLSTVDLGTDWAVHAVDVPKLRYSAATRELVVPDDAPIVTQALWHPVHEVVRGHPEYAIFPSLELVGGGLTPAGRPFVDAVVSVLVEPDGLPPQAEYGDNRRLRLQADGRGGWEIPDDPATGAWRVGALQR